MQVVLLKALEKDPDVRFQTAEDFAKNSRGSGASAKKPITTRPVRPLIRHLRWVQRNPGWAFAVYGIFVALSHWRRGCSTTTIPKPSLEATQAEKESIANAAISDTNVLQELEDESRPSEGCGQ